MIVRSICGPAATRLRRPVPLLWLLLLILAMPQPTAAAIPVVTDVSAGDFSTCARTSDSAAWCWGDNRHGQLGDGTTTDRHRPRRVRQAGGTPLADVVAVSAGSGFACAVTSGGAVWCWGDNGYGQLGNGVTSGGDHPVRVRWGDGEFLEGATAVSTADGHACARTSDGAAWCWGNDYRGQLGDGTSTEDPMLAVRVTRADGAPLADVTTVSAGGYDPQIGDVSQTCASTSDGAAWCWGGNEGGSSVTARPRSGSARSASLARAGCRSSGSSP
jgi:alpha-tubulin suppressor-like RCC1 family protein